MKKSRIRKVILSKDEKEIAKLEEFVSLEQARVKLEEEFKEKETVKQQLVWKKEEEEKNMKSQKDKILNDDNYPLLICYDNQKKKKWASRMKSRIKIFLMTIS